MSEPRANTSVPIDSQPTLPTASVASTQSPTAPAAIDSQAALLALLTQAAGQQLPYVSSPSLYVCCVHLLY